MNVPRVLLVEDDDSLRYALSRALEAEGFAVTDVADAFAAIALLEAETPVDAIVTDIILRERSPQGISLARMAHYRRRDLPTIFITAFPDAVAHAEVFGRVLVKPVDPLLLAETVRGAIAQRNLSSG